MARIATYHIYITFIIIAFFLHFSNYLIKPVYKIFRTSLLFITILITKAYSQSTLIKGTVINNRDSAVAGATITISNITMISYITSTDTLGMFKIPSSYYKTGYVIKINALGYNPFTINKYIDLSELKKKSVNLGLIKLSVFNHQLKEVVIKSTKRYRDTIKIDLSKQNFQRSVMIDDLFSQDGFSKDANNQLYYKGIPVSDIEVNGAAFFGKNNMDVYHLLPALVLNGIEIVQTNIDSATNTTTLRPSIKVNLKLKEKYVAGYFGNANLGGGSSSRYLVNMNMYFYKNNEQVSVFVNSNNTDLNQPFLLNPTISFSSGGNNQTISIAKFSYRNIIAKKIELNFECTADVGDKYYISDSKTQYSLQNEFSSAYNSAKSHFKDLKDTKLTINYKIDTLNTLNATGSVEYNDIKQIDSLNYQTNIDNINTISNLNKAENNSALSLSGDISYEKKSAAKKGRFFQVDVKLDNQHYDINENDNVLYSYNQAPQNYFVAGKRYADEFTLNNTVTYTEPVNDDGFIKLFSGYKNDRLNYIPSVNSDTIKYSNIPATIENNYFQSGITFQKTIKRFSFYETAIAAFTNETIQARTDNNQKFFNLNLNLQADCKADAKNNLSFNLLSETHYPNVEQLTAINNTFDLGSQTAGNLYLKPELVKTAKINYTYKKSDSLNMVVSGSYSHYNSRFGYAITTGTNNIQYETVQNTGNSNAASVSFLINKIIHGHSLIYNASLGYSEYPEILTNGHVLNNSTTFLQTFSSPITINNFITTSPTLASSYIKYYYASNNSNVIALTYSDKVTFNILKLQLNLYPLFNYNHSIGNTTSWSMNTELKKSFLKDYGSIWIQAYDIFNSFKYINNYIGPDYIQTLKYSNVERYIIFGLSFKFNNAK